MKIAQRTLVNWIKIKDKIIIEYQSVGTTDKTKRIRAIEQPEIDGFKRMVSKSPRTQDKSHWSYLTSESKRVSLLFAASMTGEKFPPVFIGKSANPRCLKNVNRKNLGVVYKNNANACMIVIAI